MSAYTRLCSAGLFPLHEWVKGHRSVALRRELEVTQWLPAPQLEQLQAARLRGFLRQIADSVPYYRTLFARCAFEPAALRAVGDLRQLPFLTRALVHENLGQLKSMKAGRLIRYSTGGSTGEPLVFFLGAERVTHDVAAKWRATRWWNVDIGDREIVLWGSPLELAAQDRMRRWRDVVLRTRLLPAFEMSAAKMDEYLAVMRRARPRMLFGYASALGLLADRARSRGVAMNDLGVRVAFVTGEMLFPHQRRIIEGVFGAPAANGYGSRDAGFIAHQCPAGSLHVCAEHVILELVKEDGSPAAPGESGEIVTTHLATGDFPFVRYRTGDLAVWSDHGCACGRGLPVLETVHGRATDFIYTRSGNVMHALALIYEVRDQPGVRAFKFVQSEDLTLELQLVAEPTFGEQAERETLGRLRRRVGEDTPVRITRVTAIAPEKSGKYRYVVSRAPQAGGG